MNSSLSSNKTAIIMAGGTGGHIFPGLAVARELQYRGWTIHWLGSKGGMEQKIISAEKIPLHLISVVGLRGNGLIGWIKAPFTLLAAIVQAINIIRTIKPNVVIGFGGFASGPGGLASYLLGKTLFIHEQNAVAGLTNKMLAKIATVVFQAFPNTLFTKNGAITVGNPIRKTIREIEKTSVVDKQQSTEIINVLIVGGSRGAKVINQEIPNILSSLINKKVVSIRHQCGKNNLKETQVAYNEIDKDLFSDSVQINEFIDDMANSYQWANIVICRAGASTVSEIAAVGIAAIFIPYPFAVDDHQTMNAKWLEEQEAAIIIQQKDLVFDESKKFIRHLILNKELSSSMAEKAKDIAYLNAASEMSDVCDSLLEKVA